MSRIIDGMSRVIADEETHVRWRVKYVSALRLREVFPELFELAKASLDGPLPCSCRFGFSPTRAGGVDDVLIRYRNLCRDHLAVTA